MSGRWHQPDNATVIAHLAREFGLADPAAFVAALELRGLVVRAPFYVPDVDELYVRYRRLSDVASTERPHIRWVMCRETYDELARLHDGGRVPPSHARERSLTVIEHTPGGIAGNLFGIPVRLDPAARSPLFEISSDATLTTT
jgi:hypothetical protein